MWGREEASDGFRPHPGLGLENCQLSQRKGYMNGLMKS